MKLSIALTLITLAFLTNANAQEPSRTLERIYKIDKAGDAEIEFKFQLNARQWAAWKDQYGDHPDLMLREVKYQLAAAVIDDFSLQKDEVHRSATSKIKARSLARYRGNGEFQLEVPKDMKLVSGSGTDWAFTSSTLENGGIVNITDRAKLPEGAQNARLVNGNDYNWLTYKLEVSPAKPKALLYGGIGLLGAAIALGGLSFAFGKSSSL